MIVQLKAVAWLLYPKELSEDYTDSFNLIVFNSGIPGSSSLKLL